MPAHKHAALMLQYAQDAQETDTPWDRWQTRLRDTEKWWTLLDQCSWLPTYEYRRKPVTINVNGFDVPAPLKTMPTQGAVWLVVPHAEEYTSSYGADGQDWKRIAASRGLFHATKEAAVAHAKAMLGIDPYSGE